MKLLVKNIDSEIYSKESFGKIYVATNILNGKVYVGLVKFPRTIKVRWLEHLSYGRILRRKRKKNPSVKITSSHFGNALAKYNKKIWNVVEIDNAYNKLELDNKEDYWINKYDSRSRYKGYNCKSGGSNGKLSQEMKNHLSKKMKENWEDPDFRKRMIKGTSEGMKKKWKDPIFREKVIRGDRKALEEKWKNPIFREKMIKIRRNRINPKWKKLKNKREFLHDIKKGYLQKELAEKYKMHSTTIQRRIIEILDKYGIKYYKDAVEFLRNKDIDKILEEIEN